MDALLEGAQRGVLNEVQAQPLALRGPETVVLIQSAWADRIAQQNLRLAAEQNLRPAKPQFPAEAASATPTTPAADPAATFLHTIPRRLHPSVRTAARTTEAR